MSTQDNKLIKLVTKLIRLTIANHVKWELSDVPRNLTEGTDDIISTYLSTEYMDKEFALFVRKYQQYSGEFDTMYWTQEIKLAIIENDEVIWENKQPIPSLVDLLDHAQSQVSGLNDFIDKFLED